MGPKGYTGTQRSPDELALEPLSRSIDGNRVARAASADFLVQSEVCARPT